MWFRRVAVLLSVPLLVAAAAFGAMPFEKKGVSLTLSAAKVVYSPGETIPLRMTLFNGTQEELVLHFNTSQRYDFIVEAAEGKGEVWRWSKGRMFLQVLGEEKAGPGRPIISYAGEIPSGLERGSYIVTGVITSSDAPLSVSIPLQVR